MSWKIILDAQGINSHNSPIATPPMETLMQEPNHEQFVEQEISTAEQRMAYLIEMKDKIAIATNDLIHSYRGIIEAKAEFERIKKQNIEEIRTYKFTVSAECKEIERQVKAISDLVARTRLDDLRVFTDCCERLAALEASGFFRAFRLASA